MKIENVEHPDKSFIEIFSCAEEEWEVLTDTGWSEISSTGKTVPYQIWHTKTDNCEILTAFEHIVYKYVAENSYVETFACELLVGDYIFTKFGDEIVQISEETHEIDNLYYIQLKDANHRYFSNKILSHNSIVLCNLASQGVRNGYNTAFISLEMSDRKVVKRLGANLLGIKVSEYARIAENPRAIKDRINMVATDDPFKTVGALKVKEFPTSTASAVDMENWLKRMEELKGIKFRLVVIDYINIMKNWRNPNTENTYMKIKQIAEDLRAMGMRNGWTIVTATQVGRSAYSSSDMILEQISESAGLIHTVDSMFGIIQDEIMYMNQEYFIKNLANRDDGYKGSKKKFFINYDYMRITEDVNSEIILNQF